MNIDHAYRDELAAVLGNSTLYVGSLLVPLAAYAVLSHRTSVLTKTLIAASVTTVVGALFLSSYRAYAMDLVAVAIGTAYFALCAAAIYAAHQRRSALGVPSAAMFMFAACFFVLVPAVVAPAPGRVLILLAGWEMMLSAYSFYVDASQRPEQSRLRDCLVFVVINPCLVLAESGKLIGPPRLDPAGLRRVGVGACTLVGHAALFSSVQVYSGLSDASFARWPVSRELPIMVLFYLVHVVMGYMTHSGRASLQIGMMRLMGHALPERYNYPLFSKDPADFWRRWNIYAGAWFRRYVFFPSTVRCSRRFSRSWRTLSLPLAVLITFAACGLWHDLAVYARTREIDPGATIVFILHGVLVLVWALIAAGVSRGSRALPQLRVLGAGASRLCFLPTLALLTWLVLPSLAGAGMHPVLGQALRWVVR